MKPVFKFQIALLMGAVALLILLYFIPKSPSSVPNKEQHQTDASSPCQNINTLIKSAVKSLEANKQTLFQAIENQINKFPSEENYNKMIDFWNTRKQPYFMAHYYELSTLLQTKSYENYVKIGDIYFNSVQFEANNQLSKCIYQEALRNYKLAINLDTNKLDAQIQIANCIILSSEKSMEGIAMLKKIEKKDSLNLKLQLSFALLSSKSQQWLKAINRFEKVLKINSNYIEAYLHIAEAYQQLNNIPKAIIALEKYVYLTPNKDEKQEILKYINELKSKHSS